MMEKNKWWRLKAIFIERSCPRDQKSVKGICRPVINLSTRQFDDPNISSTFQMVKKRATTTATTTRDETVGTVRQLNQVSDTKISSSSTSTEWHKLKIDSLNYKRVFRFLFWFFTVYSFFFFLDKKVKILFLYSFFSLCSLLLLF